MTHKIYNKQGEVISLLGRIEVWSLLLLDHQQISKIIVKIISGIVPMMNEPTKDIVRICPQ